MVILFHGNHPRNIVKGHSAQSEIGVIWDLAHFLDKGVQVGSRNAVDRSEEIGGREAIMVRWRTAALVEVSNVLIENHDTDLTLALT